MNWYSDKIDINDEQQQEERFLAFRDAAWKYLRSIGYSGYTDATFEDVQNDSYIAYYETFYCMCCIADNFKTKNKAISKLTNDTRKQSIKFNKFSANVSNLEKSQRYMRYRDLMISDAETKIFYNPEDDIIAGL
jgi:hypothetical protein